MLRFRWTIVLSVVFHLVFFALAALFYKEAVKQPPALTELVFEFIEKSEDTAPVRLLPPAVSVIENNAQNSKAETTETHSSDPRVVEPELNVSPEFGFQESICAPDYFEILTGNTRELRERAVRQNLLQNSLKESVHHTLDSVQTRQRILAYAMSRFLMNPDQLKKLGTRPDAVGSSQTAKSLGSNPGMVNIPGLIVGLGRSLAGLLGDKPGRPMVGGAVGLPTLLEIDVLNNLWTKGRETDHKLYSALDTTYKLTQSDFNQILDVMTKKGWLVRQKISPENIFTIATPLGGIPVEMSAKNRRNPVYEYRPVINQEMVMRALNLAAFHLEDSAKILPDSLKVNTEWEKKRVHQKIMKLIEN